METYANDGIVTDDMPCIRAFPDRVAFGSLSTELGDVNICLNAFYSEVISSDTRHMAVLTKTSILFLNKPLQGFSGS